MAAECEILAAPFGGIELWAIDGHLSRIVLSPDLVQCPQSRTSCSSMLLDLKRQLERYIEDPRQAFSWEAPPLGTPFQHRVWRALREIPPGEVRTYGELARSLGSGSRAVAGACRANPWPLLIPCHRIIGASGAGGYCGHTQGPYLAIKQWLLAHERRR